MRFEDCGVMKNAIVTGATRGIGFAVAKMLLEAGYYVIVTYGHDDEEAQKAKLALAEISSHFEIVRVNQANKQDLKKFTDAIRVKGHIDCLVCNAGMTLRNATLSEIDDDGWEQVMMVNVNSCVYMIRDLYDVIPHESRIVFIASLLGVHPHSMSLAYGVTKSAVIALAKNLVKYFEGTDTTVNAIAPGFVETEWQKTKPKEIRENIIRKTAVKRFATPDEIADTVRFCLENGFVNGSVIEVSGGYSFK